MTDELKTIVMDETQEMLVQGFKPDGIIGHLVDCFGLTDSEAVAIVDETAAHPITKILVSATK